MNKVALSSVLIFLLQLCLSTNGIGQMPVKEIIQSPYYDALTVHFANMGYWVYFTPSPEVGERKQDVESIPGSDSFGNPDDPTPMGLLTINEGSVTIPPTAVNENPEQPDAVNIQPDDTLVTSNKDNGIKTYSIDIYNSLNGNLIESLILDTESIYLHLNAHYFDDDGDTTKQIIAEVFSRNAGLDTSLDPDAIEKVYSENRYWNSGFLNYHPDDSKKVKDDISKLIALDSKDLLKVGGAPPLSAQIFADGLADFLIMRVSEEMDLLFISQLKNAFDKYEEMRTLFPETNAYLKDRSVEEFTLALAKFKDATKTDLTNIVYNISELGNLDKLKPVFNEYPELSLLFTVFNAAGLLQQEKSPAYIIQDIYTSKYLYHNTDTICNPTSFIKLTGMISNAMLNIRKDSIRENYTWIKDEELKTLSNERVSEIFYCLIYQGSPDILFEFANGKTINIKEIYGQIELFDILASLRETEDFIYTKLEKNKEIRGNNNEGKIDIAIIKNYVLILEKIMRTTYDVGESMAINDPRFNDLLNDLNDINNDITPIITKAIATSKHIQLQEYSLAIQEGATVIDSLLSQIQKQIDKKDTTANDYRSLKRSFSKSKSEILRYGSFIGSVAVAETSEDVSAAIKAFSLPAGSHRIKKKAAISVGLNAYMGFFYVPKKDTCISGLTAPLGLSFNAGFGNAGGISLTGYIVDVGAIITANTESSDTTTNEITWGNLFSPGFSIGYNLPIVKDYSLPFTLGCSVQWGPETIGAYNAGSILKNKAPSFRIFFVFDIPITNFYVSSRQRLPKK